MLKDVEIFPSQVFTVPVTEEWMLRSASLQIHAYHAKEGKFSNDKENLCCEAL